MNWFASHAALVWFITGLLTFILGYLFACTVWRPQVRALVALNRSLENELTREFKNAEELRGLLHARVASAVTFPAADAIPSRLRDVVEAENA